MSVSPLEKAETVPQLKQLWSRQYPKKASGGWWSLSGFSIQMTVALEQFIRENVHAENLEFEVEAVSDALLKSDTHLQLTQVKRTLTRATLASALAEAYDIASLCSPDLIDQVRFQIVCERIDSNVNFATAQPAEERGKAYDKELLARVKQSFHRDEPLRVMSHPRLTLRRTLANAGIKNPDAVAGEALGLIFDAFDGRDVGNVQLAIYRVINLIENAKIKDTPSAGNLITAPDFKPRANARSNLILRNKPRVHDLAEQRVIDRPSRLAMVEAAALCWLADLESEYLEADDMLPVFWVDGRPGDGKSVLVLQLLGRLLSNHRLGSVTQLQRPSEMEAWLNTAAPLRPRNGELEQVEIAFADDLTAIVSAEEMGQIVERSFWRPPYAGLVTCGSTHHLESFKVDNARVVITRCTIDPPTVADYRQFGDWLIEQGKLATHQAAVPSESLAAYVYRLATTKSNVELPTLRDRLRAASVYETAQVALALNVIGLSAPMALVNDATLAVFAEGERGIEFSPEIGPTGVVLGHAEVAWALFTQWAEADGELLVKAWAQALGDGLVAFLHAGTVTAARTILGEVLDAAALRRRFGKADLEAHQRLLFHQLYTAAATRLNLQQRAPLLRQFLVAGKAGRLASVDGVALRLEAHQALLDGALPITDRVEIALSLLTGKDPPKGPEFKAATAFVLSSEPTPVAVQFFSQIARRGEDTRHRALLLSWLRQHQSRPEVAKVLELAISYGDPKPLLDMGYAFVRRFYASPSSGLVLWALHRSKVPHKITIRQSSTGCRLRQTLRSPHGYIVSFFGPPNAIPLPPARSIGSRHTLRFAGCMRCSSV